MRAWSSRAVCTVQEGESIIVDRPGTVSARTPKHLYGTCDPQVRKTLHVQKIKLGLSHNI